MALFRGLFLIIAFLGWFLYQWYKTRNFAQALKNSAPAFFFIGVWAAIIYGVMHL